jgi:broad specificity phosphatase PhoE
MVVFVRHAPTPWSGHRYCGVSDPPLDAAGRAVADALAAALASGLPDDVRLVTSPRQRAMATAEAIAAALGARWTGSLDVDPRWAEADMGRAEGRTFDELVTLEPDLAVRLASGTAAVDWPDGEAAVDFAARVEAAWRELARDGRPVVVISHAGPIRLAVGLADGVAPGDVALLAPGEAIGRPLPRATVPA